MLVWYWVRLQDMELGHKYDDVVSQSQIFTTTPRRYPHPPSR
jgi:hypothetical protein